MITSVKQWKLRPGDLIAGHSASDDVSVIAGAEVGGPARSSRLTSVSASASVTCRPRLHDAVNLVIERCE